MTKIDIYAKCSGMRRRIASVSHAFVDGSIYLTLVRENETTKGYSLVLDATTGVQAGEAKEVCDVSKIVKVSYHTSGVIKYHNLSPDRILGEPLFDIHEKFCFIQYLVNDLKLLTDKVPSDSDIVVELPDKKEEQFYSFSFLISPDEPDNSVSINFCSGLFFVACFVSIVDRVEDEKNMPFYYLTPQKGVSDKLPENNACVLYHQKINDTDGVIIYKPNASGIYTMIFHEKRRNIPKSEELIQFVNTDYQAKFTSIKPHYAKFYIKHRKSGSKIVETGPLIKQIIFNNRL